MSMGQTTDAQGVDFVDFVREIWRAKWIFAITFAAVTGLAFLAFTLMEREAPAEEPAASVTSHFAYFLYRTGVDLDPFGRSSSEVLADLLQEFSKVDQLGVMDEREYFTGDYVPDLVYRIRPTGDYSGRIVLEVKGAPGTLHAQVRDQFVEAARLQFEATQARASDELAMLGELSEKIYDKPSELIAGSIYRNMRFLENRSVQQGTFRFFEFLPLQSYPPQEAPPPLSPASSARRSLLISALFGLILACSAVLFRMELQRRRQRRLQQSQV